MPLFLFASHCCSLPLTPWIATLDCHWIATGLSLDCHPGLSHPGLPYSSSVDSWYLWEVPSFTPNPEQTLHDSFHHYWIRPHTTRNHRCHGGSSLLCSCLAILLQLSPVVLEEMIKCITLSKFNPLAREWVPGSHRKGWVH